MKLIYLLLAVMGLSSAASAGDCRSIVDGEARLACFDATRDCAAIVSDAERLDCYDQAAAAADFSPAPGSERRDYDVEDRGIEAKIVGVSTNSQRIDFLELDNRQVWRETEDTRVRFEVGQQVRLRKGVFGSTNMTVDGAAKIVKVKRVK